MLHPRSFLDSKRVAIYCRSKWLWWMPVRTAITAGKGSPRLSPRWTVRIQANKWSSFSISKLSGFPIPYISEVICSRTAGLHVRLAQQRGDSDGDGCGHQKLQASQRITAYQDKKISPCSLALFRLICSAVFQVFHNA